MEERRDPAKSAAPPRDKPSGAESEYRYPDFLCIGAQKAGTTWLDKNLRRHRGLWLPPIKETQYFNHLHLPRSRKWSARYRRERGMKLLPRYLEKTPQEEWDYRTISVLADMVGGRVSDRWYGRIFALAPLDRLCGEICPDYATLPNEGIRHVLKLSPGIRVILSLRDPIERSWSHMRMNMRGGGDFDIADLERVAGYNDLFRRADYPTIVANWRKFIPEQRFLTIFMDDIATEPAHVLEKVCEFLGVRYRDKLFAKAAKAEHVGASTEMPPSILNVLKERLRPIYEGTAALYPEIGARWMARYY